MTIYPLTAVRTLALYSQGLVSANDANSNPTLPTIQKTVEQVNYIQIDSLNLIQRSQYIALWSRLGNYAPVDFDRLIYSPEERRLFEGVQTVAAIIPLNDHRYQIPQMDRGRETLIRWYKHWLDQQGSCEMVSMVLERIRQGGAPGASDF